MVRYICALKLNLLVFAQLTQVEFYRVKQLQQILPTLRLILCIEAETKAEINAKSTLTSVTFKQPTTLTKNIECSFASRQGDVNSE